MSTTSTETLAMGRVALTVHDLDRVADFYQQAVGLHRLRSDGATMALGVGATVLLELRRDTAARRRSPREAGLFHTAFLLPSRADLGGWLQHAAQTRAPIVGASDHLVSEAIYLTDPEGNGVEIYADTPRNTWKFRDGMVEMATHSLDIDAVLAQAGPTPWRGVPAGSVVGHVHLQVGAIAPAEAFYRDVLGLDITCHYPGATFYSANGYHHHLATNIWNSRGAGVIGEPSTGLSDVEILVDSARIDAITARSASVGDAGGLSLRDPWGISLTLAAIVH